MTKYRRHGRKAIKGALALEHKTLGEMVAEIRDVSATGLFVLSEDLASKLVIGDEIKVRPLFDSSLKLTELKVVRLTNEGAGFAYEW